MIKKTMLVFFVLILTIIVATITILNLPQFGKRAYDERKHRMQASPNFRDGVFHNLSPTPSFTSDDNALTTFHKMIFSKAERLRPDTIIPSVKTKLHNSDVDYDFLIWLGHSSYYMQLSGRKILVDPVLSGYASPFSFMIKAFDGSDIYKPGDIPDIDYLIITHDHWDHLDMNTIREIHPRVNQVFTGLGVGAHLEHWGVDGSKIIEFDWFDSLQLSDNFVVHATPARHFSGRGLQRNTTLWTSFVVKTPSANVFIGGDGGYDTHFAAIGNIHGPFDLALLEAGQYDRRWKYIHLMPEEVIQAAIDLKAGHLIPVHNSKFALAAHPWDEPKNKVASHYQLVKPDFQLLTPLIGERVDF